MEDATKCSRDSRESGSVELQEPRSKYASHGYVPSRDLASSGEHDEFVEEAQPGLSHEEESCCRSTRMRKPPDR